MGGKWRSLALLAMVVVAQSAFAGGRKSAVDSNESDLFGERFVAPHVASESLRHPGLGLSPVTAFDSRPERFVESHANGSASERERMNGRLDRRVRLFHFNTKFGEVGVHPLLGSAKGLQFSLGF